MAAELRPDPRRGAYALTEVPLPWPERGWNKARRRREGREVTKGEKNRKGKMHGSFQKSAPVPKGIVLFVCE